MNFANASVAAALPFLIASSIGCSAHMEKVCLLTVAAAAKVTTKLEGK